MQILIQCPHWAYECKFLLVVIYLAFCLDVAQGWMNGSLMRHKLTCEGLLVKLANHYLSRGAWSFVSFCWLANTGVFMCRSPYENMQALFNSLAWLARWEDSGCTAALLQSAASRICSKQHVTSLCSSRSDFSSGVLLKSRWCNHAVVLTRLQNGRLFKFLGVDPPVLRISLTAFFARSELSQVIIYSVRK